MKRTLKTVFYSYVILLALYVSYKMVLRGRFGRQEVDFKTPTQQCFTGGKGWKYCVYETSQTRDDVYLYVFHGKGEDESTWLSAKKYSALVQKEWQDRGVPIPKVISVSFGSVWLLTPKMSHKESGLLERFHDEVINKIEGHLGQPRQRFLLGESMGGLNVLSLSLKYPHLFSRVASLCPPLYSISPYASSVEILQFIQSSGATPYAMMNALGIGRYFFADESEWIQFSPYHSIFRNRVRRFPPLYLSASLNDEFGAYEGTLAFAQKAREKGIKVYWRANSGNHCAVDAPSLAQFLGLQK